MEAPRSRDDPIDTTLSKDTPAIQSTTTASVNNISKLFIDAIEKIDKSLKTTIGLLTNAFFVDLKKEINFKYTREGVDQKLSKDFSPNSAPQLQFKILNKMLDAVSSATIESGQAQVDEFKKCLGRSKKFFDQDITTVTSILISEKLNISNLILSKVVKDIIAEFNNLQAGESFLFPAGPYMHAVVFKITKDEDGQLLLRLYNTGYGGEFTEYQNGARSACMPLFHLDPKATDLNAVFTAIIELCTKQDAKYNQTVEKLITQHGGKRTDQNVFHNEQDRNNCAWKSLSTCFSDFVKGVKAIASKEILDKLPSAVQSELEKGPVEFRKLVKIVDYEALRTKAKQIGRTGLNQLQTQNSLKGILQEQNPMLSEKQKQVEGDKRLQELKEMSSVERDELKKDRKARVQIAQFISLRKEVNINHDRQLKNWIYSSAPKDLLVLSKQKEYLNQCEKFYPEDRPQLEELFSAIKSSLAREISIWTSECINDDLTVVPATIRNLELDKESFDILSNLLGEAKAEKMRRYLELRDFAKAIASDTLTAVENYTKFEIQPFDYLNDLALMQSCKTAEERALVRQNFIGMISQSMFDQFMEKKMSEDAVQLFIKNPNINVDVHAFLTRTIPYDEKYAKYTQLNEKLKYGIFIGFYKNSSLKDGPVPKVVQDMAEATETKQNELLEEMKFPQHDAEKFKQKLQVIAKARKVALSNDCSKDTILKEYQNLDKKACSMSYFKAMILQFMCEQLQKPYEIHTFCEKYPTIALELYTGLRSSQEPFVKKAEAIKILDAMEEMIVHSCPHHEEDSPSFPASAFMRKLATHSEIAKTVLKHLPTDERVKTENFLSFIRAASEMAQKKKEGETIPDDILMEIITKQPLIESYKTEEDKKSLLARFKVIMNQF